MMGRRTIDVESRRAAKRHACAYCDRPIEPEMMYVRIVIVSYDEDTGNTELRIVKFHRERDECKAKR